MRAQVCGVHLSILASIHYYIQGEAAMGVSLFTARSSSHMDLHLEVTAGEAAISTFSPTNILPPSRPFHRGYEVTPADRERERGNMDALVCQLSYGYL
jgi:hypothetical protein